MIAEAPVTEIRWLQLRCVELLTGDGLPALPVHVSWVRHGILVVGLDHEMHVYSQWRPDTAAGPLDALEDEDVPDDGPSNSLATGRVFSELTLTRIASASNLNKNKGFKISPSVANMKLAPSVANLAGRAEGKEEAASSLYMIQDCGLFEAARLANPVLPQYHPKQLIELLNFGRIRRVKAILAHLVRCISGKHQTQVRFSHTSLCLP